MFNFESIAEEFINNASCRVVHDSKSLANEFIHLLANKDEALKMIEAASKILDRNSGASDRQLSVIMDFLEGANE
jgi:3-deoxy-D-manno-octulosonic-acid transferase